LFFVKFSSLKYDDRDFLSHLRLHS
jgi:hypothetical protein